MTIRLGTPLDTVLYPLGSGATKEVRYWGGHPLDVRKRAPDDEVDVVSWLPARAALHRLTYDHDKELPESDKVNCSQIKMEWVIGADRENRPTSLAILVRGWS